jgi:hypothetical protein
MAELTNFFAGYLGDNGFRYALMSDKKTRIGDPKAQEAKFQFLAISPKGDIVGTYNAKMTKNLGYAGTEFQTDIGTLSVANSITPQISLEVKGGKTITMRPLEVDSLEKLKASKAGSTLCGMLAPCN